MAFDAGMVAAAAAECRTAIGARIDKIYQPDKDTVLLLLHTKDGVKKLMFTIGANAPRFGFTDSVRENPITAPMFCMLLRKHLTSAKLSAIEQVGFERVVRFIFDTHDEMGFAVVRILVCEIMGKYSNLSMLDENNRVIGILHPVDFSMSQKRQLLPGMQYQMPPAQEKTDPTTETRERFFEKIEQSAPDIPADKYLLSRYLGISQLTARELVFLASGATDTPLGSLILRRLWDQFSKVFEDVKAGRFTPIYLKDPSGRPIEYSFFPITQYKISAEQIRVDTFGELFDRYFETKDRLARVRNRAQDIQHLLATASARLEKKLAQQEKELAECEKMDEYRTAGDTITTSIWQLKQGMNEAKLTDYAADPPTERVISLDPRLSPAQNAQAYYKKYQKAKIAKRILTEQIEKGKEERAYLATVEDSLSRAELESDFAEIRSELSESGYASRIRRAMPKKLPPSVLLEFRTSGGYRVLAGKNNRQNEYLTHKLAEKDDYWFHVKDRPGGHVVMFCGGEEPPAADFSEAAMIAAWCCNHTGEAKNTAVDYTLIRHLKKTPGGKPGAVIYHTYWTAYVTPSSSEVEKLRVGKGKGSLK